MIVVKVWRLPSQSEEALSRLYKNIVATLSGLAWTGVADESDVLCLFPDITSYGLGSDILAEISGLENHHSIKVRQNLAEELGHLVKGLYPNAQVECSVSTNIIAGFWSSRPAKTKRSEEQGEGPFDLSDMD